MTSESSIQGKIERLPQGNRRPSDWCKAESSPDWSLASITWTSNNSEPWFHMNLSSRIQSSYSGELLSGTLTQHQTDTFSIFIEITLTTSGASPVSWEHECHGCQDSSLSLRSPIHLSSLPPYWPRIPRSKQLSDANSQIRGPNYLPKIFFKVNRYLL